MDDWFSKKAAYCTLAVVVVLAMMLFAPMIPATALVTAKMITGGLLILMMCALVIAVIYGLFYLMFEG